MQNEVFSFFISCKKRQGGRGELHQFNPNFQNISNSAVTLKINAIIHAALLTWHTVAVR